jgi:iron complex outermembrane recepter protein
MKVNAQTYISGSIHDEVSREPLPGVNVIIKNTTIGSAADEKGFFIITTDRQLPFTIQVSMVGYKTREILIENNQPRFVFYLAQESFLNEEIVVVAKEIEVEEKTFRTVVSMELMDALSIRETPSSSFYEAIGHLKGVDVVRQSVQFTTINARGFNSTENTRLVQMVDGMDNMAPGMNFPIGNIAGLNELDIESVEFIAGPAEVKYGGNALNGVLIMKSKDPFKHQGLGLYINPGISDVVPGNDYPFQFFVKPQMETAIRIANAWNDRFALKLTASYFTGKDWYADDTTNIRPGNIKWEPDPGHDAINKYGDEIISDLTLGPKRENVIVSRTGYRDKDLVDNNVENLKLNGSLHFKLPGKVKATLLGNYGRATTVYTGDNRVSLSGFKIYQGKAEIEGNHFLLRGYSSFQNSGKSFDAKYLAIHLNELASSNEDWFHEYYHAYQGSFRVLGVMPFLHHEAREYADRNRLMPGTAKFNEAKSKITSETDYQKGAGIYNHSALHHLDLMFDRIKITNNTSLDFGGSYRYYDLNSRGTIFPDTVGNDITVYEVGSFIETLSMLIDNKLTVKTALRADKSENFPVIVSPRLFVVYNLNEHNNFKFSVLSGSRNPGVKEQFINKNLGDARYIGGLSKVLQPYEIGNNSFFLDDVNAFNEAVKFDVQNNPYTLNLALLKNLDILERGIVNPEFIDHIKPEKIVSIEGGFKTRINRALYLDAIYFNSFYHDFIGLAKVVKPRTSPQIDLFTAATQVNKSAQHDVYFIHVNASHKVNIHGLAIGYKWLTPLGAIISGNTTLTDINTHRDDPVIPGFNTPGIKTNLSLQNRRLDKMENNPGFRNIGYKITWRYQNRFLWESAFGDGYMPRISTVDVQFTTHFTQPKSFLKFGASNFFNNKFSYSFGGSKVGVVFYASYIVDDIFSFTKR